MIPDDTRSRQLQDWLEAQPGHWSDLALLRADASFRRYFRARHEGDPVVLMDAPPDREATEPFVQIAQLLQKLGLRPPRVLAHDPAAGFVVLEDLGDRTFTRALAEGEPEGPLYDRAIDTLIQLHRAWPPAAAAAPALPAYDLARLLDEAALLVDWYGAEAAGAPLPTASRDAFLAAWAQALDALPPLPSTLVLRDFHVDNLMLPPDTEAGCAVLDFQDAVIGSPAYDVVSLLEDARREVSPATVERGLERYLAGSGCEREAFLRHYRVLGAQRTTKILGIFVRLARRDAKPRYLEHLPRLERLLARALAHPDLAPVRAWFQQHMPERLGEP
ncbi:aminoglycoside phosphotransferase family protein [Thioalkalivibrio sp. ALJ16]|uniref:aminoglycoside phosphotransferase family protein n=1 Tax=Thioalkalivibrio sp. ALJ16 TaxID=1158762 RepID=UPI00036C1EEC|nr:phosphotransferase [Thioalkalivibrio sp. ALJ16]